MDPGPGAIGMVLALGVLGWPRGQLGFCSGVLECPRGGALVDSPLALIPVPLVLGVLSLVRWFAAPSLVRVAFLSVAHPVLCCGCKVLRCCPLSLWGACWACYGFPSWSLPGSHVLSPPALFFGGPTASVKPPVDLQLHAEPSLLDVQSMAGM